MEYKVIGPLRSREFSDMLNEQALDGWKLFHVATQEQDIAYPGLIKPLVFTGILAKCNCEEICNGESKCTNPAIT